MKFSIEKKNYYNVRLNKNIILIFILKAFILLFQLKIIIKNIYGKVDVYKQLYLNYKRIFMNLIYNYDKTYKINYQTEQEKLLIEISKINYSFSFKFHMAKISFNIAFYNQNKNLIIPSDLTLYYKLHIICKAYDIISNAFVKSIANIYKDIHYNCIEYFNINEKINFGIIIYKKDRFYEYKEVYLFTNNLFDYNNLFNQNDSEYDPFILINKYIQLERKIDAQNNLENNLLIQSYLSIPNFSIKAHFARKENIWYFKNIYNNYFCICKSSNISTGCLINSTSRYCKYKYYLNIIDNNRFLFNKTDYLLSDFSSPDTAPCESYLVFKEMFKQNLNVHFMTQREDIFNEYNNLNYIKKMPIIYGSNYIDGDFLEKYLDLFLRLKATISGAKIYSYNNLFYNIEYITYICLGHGITYLKDFLYKDYYSNKTYNKIVLPDSDIIISNAMKYGWTIEKIIKIGLPRWDIFYNYEKTLLKRNNSIFVMFTWRDLKKNRNISSFYFKNIFGLIKSPELFKNLESNKITLYFTLHHNMEEYKYIFNNNKYIKYIKQDQINECLTKCDLLITDFSSIIFDIMIRFKPYILFIPDSEDPKISKIYNKTYYDIINGMKNGTIYFENKYFNLNETIKKIIFYINNNFTLEPKIKKFYESFKLEGGENTKKIIYYLKNLK